MVDLLRQTVIILHKSALSSLVLCAISGLLRYKRLDKAARFFLAYNVASCICELIAFYMMKHRYNSYPLNNIYGLLEFTLISLYFSYQTDVFKARKIGYYIAGIGLLAGIINMIFFQPISEINTNFINFEGLGIISMCLFSYVRILLKDNDVAAADTPHFWFTSTLAFFWSVTFAAWSFDDYFRHHSLEMLRIIGVLVMIVSIICSLGQTLIYLRFYSLKRKQVQLNSLPVTL